jgi:hypothetical protein
MGIAYVVTLRAHIPQDTCITCEFTRQSDATRFARMYVNGRNMSVGHNGYNPCAVITCYDEIGTVVGKSRYIYSDKEYNS